MKKSKIDSVTKFTVNLKFYRGKNDKLMGFVTRYNGSWHGCGAECLRPKKIVLLDAELSDVIMPEVLYRTQLIPMRENNGFVAIHATPVQFEAKIKTIFNDEKKPCIKISFGYKSICYRPSRHKSKYSDISAISNLILHRIDIKDAYQVNQDFLEMARELDRYLTETA